MGPATMFQRLDHVGILVRDLGRTKLEFTTRFGMVIDAEEDVASVRVRLCYLTLPGCDNPCYVQLVQPTGDSPLADYLSERGEGLHHICFAVSDIEHARSELDGEQDSKVFVGGRSRRACFLAGRAGNTLVELTETD